MTLMSTVGMSFGWRRLVAGVLLLILIAGATAVGAAADDRADEHDHEPGVRATRHRCEACGQDVASPPPRQQRALVGKAICRACYFRADHRWQSLDRCRYATFADGTLVDLKHFRASMLTSQVAGYGLRTALRGVLAANLAGWGVEWQQVAQGHEGGQPFGRNEDLYSNLAGSVFGQLARFGGNSADWGGQSIGVLERFHGPLRRVSDTK